MFTLCFGRSILFSSLLVLSTSAGILIGCSNKNGVEGDNSATGGSTAIGTVHQNQGGSVTYVAGQGGSSGATTATGGDTSNVVTPIPWPPSSDYTNVTNVTYGAYALGPDISNGTVPPNTGTTCQGMLFGVVRDFMMGTTPGGHPDFETAPDSTQQNGVKGIVASVLGSGGKPVFASPTDPLAGTHTQADFDEWYNDTPGVNMTYIVAMQLTTVNGVSTFSASINNPGGLPDSSYFPLDKAGFGNQTQDLHQGCPDHNFSFTTEIHTSFVYQGQETFTFVGDDDVWVFINNQLVIDLGGRHAQLTGSVSLDSLGLTVGSSYPLDVFNAERHTTQSNFRIDTTLALANCGTITTPGGVIIY